MNTKLLNLPPEIRKEIEEFASEVERLHRGEVGDDEFKRFRLQQGIYGQRQADQQMVRTKLPQGRVTSDQLKCLADFADRYSNKILHVTTRQDIQFHFVKIDDVPKGLEDLAEAGLTTREACGNTVRNVTACHKAGTCANEVFDVTPYGRAVTGFLLRHARTQNLPRKFKISLGGCKGCGLALMHDIGLTAQIRKENGAEVRGFRVVVGGGLGSSPHIAELLTEFLPADQLLRMCEAIVSVFDKYGDKKNRNKARFKFVLDKLGIEKIRELYREEFDALEGTGYPPIEVPPSADPHMPAFSPTREFDADPEFKAWVVRNTCEQKQKGFFNIQIKLLLGDMTSAQARLISGIAARFAAGVIVNTVNQNVMIPWVKKEAFGNIFGELRQAELHKAGTEEIRDITCCPGSETCNLGITASRGLAHFLSDEMENGFPQSTDLDHISIKASGCPNSCGQHHIASIGLHGGAKKVNGILTPHYEFFLGGHVSEDEMVFGTPVIKIPAKNTSAAVRKTIETYKNEKQDGETFWQFVDRRGKSYFRELLDEFKNLDDIEKNPLAYLDFGSDQKFTLEDRGQGECAGAVTDMITDYLTAAKRAQFQGKLALEKGALREAVDHARRSVVSSARALLVTEGMDFDLDIECIRKFESLILDMEIVSPQYSELMARFEENVDALDPETTSWWVETSGGLQKECEQVHERMQKDRSLRIR
ncbi:MAG: sulfite reductase, partial [Nitrospinae bacterium CG11_big_fil_rev_8_21_14_0_20_56_8]